MKTRVICLEGITGAGKTLQTEYISDYLRGKNHSCLVVNEKEYPPFRQTILDWHHQGANQCFSREDIEHIARARGETHRIHFSPLIGRLEYFIFDRCLYTSSVYQADGELNPEEIIQLNLTLGAIKPQGGVVLLCSPEIALERIERRRRQKTNYSLPSIHETLAEITKRRALYLTLVEQYSELHLINTTCKSETEVFEEVKWRLKL